MLMSNEKNKQICLETEINIKYNELIFISILIKGLKKLNIKDMDEEQYNEIYIEYYMFCLYIDNIGKL